eukprot:TRINITY_DN5626_c1_g1_i6.p3 TRINITY_DN5626_c1_g1~~TRINITY_DN5626_c1_g1_i6.p3  ORF type:complete len:107 (+),score=14.39 TRINITY_DN5626_c1_g1_i6:178-498(+)
MKTFVNDERNRDDRKRALKQLYSGERTVACGWCSSFHPFPCKSSTGCSKRRGLRVICSLTGLFPRAHERNSHTRALGKSGAGFEHTTWEANPCLMPIAQLQKSFYI